MYNRKRPTSSTSTSAVPTKRRRGGKVRRYKPISTYRHTSSEVKSLDLPVVTPNSLVGVSHVAGVTGGLANNDFSLGMTCLNLIQQGAAFYQRIGTKVNIKSIELYGTFKQTVDATHVAYGRYLIVYDRQPNGAYPAIGDLLQNNDTTLSFNSGINLVNRSRFTVIRDKRFGVDAGAGLQFCVKEYCKGLWETEFGTNTGTVADIRTGALYFIAFQENAGAGGGAALNPYELKCRVRYWDN